MANDLLNIDHPAPPRQRVAIVVIAGVFGLAVATAAALWAHYGTTVFFQTIATGLAACF